MVAGDFAVLEDEYITGSGRRIELAIYADHERYRRVRFCHGALHRSLRWEEEKYDREYDLDLYNIVALTGHIGAMENKGLNIFDANGICADPEISTDNDYLIIERILAHEVFHNWSGKQGDLQRLVSAEPERGTYPLPRPVLLPGHVRPGGETHRVCEGPCNAISFRKTTARRLTL